MLPCIALAYFVFSYLLCFRSEGFRVSNSHRNINVINVHDISRMANGSSGLSVPRSVSVENLRLDDVDVSKARLKMVKANEMGINRLVTKSLDVRKAEVRHLSANDVKTAGMSVQNVNAKNVSFQNAGILGGDLRDLEAN